MKLHKLIISIPFFSDELQRDERNDRQKTSILLVFSVCEVFRQKSAWSGCSNLLISSNERPSPPTPFPKIKQLNLIMQHQHQCDSKAACTASVLFFLFLLQFAVTSQVLIKCHNTSKNSNRRDYTITPFNNTYHCTQRWPKKSGLFININVRNQSDCGSWIFQISTARTAHTRYVNLTSAHLP